jgi:exopolysaccharide biosynthesis polyprenyl glycosylphosphotransferase
MGLQLDDGKRDASAIYDAGVSREHDLDEPLAVKNRDDVSHLRALDESLPISWLHLLSEAAIVFAAFAFAHYIRFTSGMLPPPIESVALERYVLMGAIAAPLIVILHLAHGLYFQKITAAVSEEIGALVNAQVQSFLLIVFVSFFNRDFPSSRITLLLIVFAAFAGCLILRLILRSAHNAMLAAGLNAKPVVVVGASPLGDLLARRIEMNPLLGYRLKERVELEPQDLNSFLVSLRHVVKDSPIPPAMLIAGELPDAALSRLIAECFASGIECILPSERTAVAGLPTNARMMEGIPVVKPSSQGELAWVRFKKRVFDILVVVALSPIWLPILFLVSLVSLIAQGAPVFFAHTRVGRCARAIRLFKFRTMLRNADKVQLPPGFDEKHKSADDPRVTPFGRFLRKTSLDELPQLLNILRGDISLVGPRPIVTDELARYGDWAGLLLSVPPGLTGLWQVSGRSELSYDQRVELDTYYIHNWSLALDVRILVATLPAVLMRKGAC